MVAFMMWASGPGSSPAPDGLPTVACHIRVELKLDPTCDLESIYAGSVELETAFLDSPGKEVLTVAIAKLLDEGMNVRIEPSFSTPLPNWPVTCSGPQEAITNLERLAALATTLSGPFNPYPVLLWAYPRQDESSAIEAIAALGDDPGSKGNWYRLVKMGVVMITVDPTGMSFAGQCGLLARLGDLMRHEFTAREISVDLLSDP